MTTQPENMRNHWWWRPGWEVGKRFYTWHLTFAEQNDVHRMAAAYRAGLADVGALTLIPDEWLHLTMQGLGFVGEITEDQAQDVARAAGHHLSKVERFDLQLGPAVLDPEAILLDVAPNGPVRAVRDAIRTGIGDVLGEVPEQASGFTPHVSVAYSAGDGPAAPVARALAGLAEVPPATARITAAQLIVLHRDRMMYEWETFAQAPLG